jgi:hypothetical protein
VCNDDLSQLVIKGKPTQLQLEAANEAISAEYTTLTQDKRGSALLECVKNITYLTNRINQIQLLVHAQFTRPSNEIAALLRDYGFPYDYTEHKHLELTVMATKRDISSLKRWEDEYATHNKGSKSTTSDFMNLIADVASEQGYAINPREVTVSEYVGMYNNYKKKRE